jgi:hypothetical protein
VDGQLAVLGRAAEALGERDRRAERGARLLGQAASSGVSNRPGAIVFTRMPTPARSRAAGRVMPTTPPLEALYAICPIWPSNAAIEAVLTMTPRSPSSVGSFALIAAAAKRSDVERADEVDPHDGLERLQRVRAALARGALAQPTPAQ